MNSYKTKRNIRRFFREFKYYFKENRFIFIIIFIILLVSIGSYAFVNRNVYKREYNENDSLAAGYINFKIKDSYISSLSLNGDVINNDKSYVIIQIELTNRYREDKEFNFGDLELVINKKYISPNISLGNYFKDFGLPFSGSLVKGNTSGTYILVYEIDKYLIYNSLAIETYSSFDNTSGGLGVLSKKINIKPTIINNTVITNNVGRGTNIDLSNTNLNKTTASILDHILINRYEYNYNYCLSNGECYNSVDAFTSSYDKTLLVLNYTLSLDSESTYMYSNKSYKTFFEDFMKIKYVLNNKNYYLNVKLKNNANYDKKLVIEVPSELNDASSIEAVITVRNLSYAIKLK